MACIEGGAGLADLVGAREVERRVVDVVAEIFRRLRQLLQRPRRHARHEVGEEGDADEEHRDRPRVVGALRRRGRARRQHGQHEVVAVAQAHGDALACAAPLHAHQAEHDGLLARRRARRRTRGQRPHRIAFAHAGGERLGEFGIGRGERGRVGVDVGQLHAGTVGHVQVGLARGLGDDFRRHDQLLGPVEVVQVAELVDDARALGVGQQLGQRGREQDAQQQGSKHAARHRAEESSHAPGSTVTWPAST
jgi:hypothetical protein